MPGFGDMLRKSSGKKKRKKTDRSSGRKPRERGISGRSTTATLHGDGAVRGGRMKKRPTGLTPVVTPRRPVESKEDEAMNMTEQEERERQDDDSHLPRGQEHFGDLPERFEFIRYLGHGSYGHVCEGTDTQTGNKCAIKKIMKIFDNDIDAKRLLRELRILRLLKGHDNVVDLIDIVPPSDLDSFNSIILVFEFVDTDLAKLVQSEQFFTTLHVQYMLYQMLLGLKYMHSGNIAHRDLKPANILVNENCTLKLCDFGLARGLTENIEQPHAVAEAALTEPTPEEQKHQERIAKKRAKGSVQRNMTKHVVTRWYRAPEVILLQQRRDTLKAIDMWSIGCIMAELLLMQKENCSNPSRRQPVFPGRSSFPLSANDPFAWADRTDQLNVIFDVIGTPSPEDIDKLQDDKARSYLTSLPQKPPMNFRDLFPGANESCLDLLKGMLTFDVENRYTVDQAISHPFLARVRDPESEHAHDLASFEFEDVAVTLHQLRALIIDEIAHFNPALQERLRAESRALSADAVDEV